MTKTELNAAVEARLAESKEALARLNDAIALDVTALFPEWAIGRAFAAAERVRCDNKLYRCEQSHTSRAGWAPPDTPALWTEVAKPGEIPVWRQPTGAQDAYHRGDRVHYPDAAGPVYESAADGNVWSPDEYPEGWILLPG